MAALLASSQRLVDTGNTSTPSLSECQKAVRSPNSTPISTPDEQILPSDDEAQLMLGIFRSHMAPQFPFVVIPLDMTPAELQKEKPFLYLTIMMVSCHAERSRQIALSRHIREYLANAVIVRVEMSLDLLQGLMVWLAWYHFQLQLDGQLTYIYHLMLSLLVDLDLSKKASKYDRSKPSWSSLRAAKFHQHRQVPPERSLEERRTFLGCFYLSSMYLSNFILLISC